MSKTLNKIFFGGGGASASQIKKTDTKYQYRET